MTELDDSIAREAQTVRHDSANDSRPKEDSRPWYKQEELRKLYLMMPILFLGSITFGYGSSSINGLQMIQSWNTFFRSPEGSRLGLFGAVLNIGSFTASAVTPYIADIGGRRMGIAVACWIVVTGALLQACSSGKNKDAMFLVGRGIVGMGCNMSSQACPILVAEVTHPRHRGKVTTMYNTGWHVGAALAAWIMLGTLTHLDEQDNLAWRLPMGLLAVMPGIQLFLVWLLPESPRWLISKGRYHKARTILTKYHGNGDVTTFVSWEFEEISKALEIERAASATNGWYELMRTPGNRKRCCLVVLTAVFSQCSGSSLVSFYLSRVLVTVGYNESSAKAKINGAFTLWCWIVSFVSALLVDRVGRKKLFLVSAVGMLVAFSIWTACSAVFVQTQSRSAASGLLAMIFLFSGVTSLAWPGLASSYVIEILPFGLRTKGLTLNFVVTAVAAITNIYVNPVGLQTLSWKFYFVYIAILVMECLIISFFFVETKGKTLEDTAGLFDQPQESIQGLEAGTDGCVATHRMNRNKTT